MLTQAGLLGLSGILQNHQYEDLILNSAQMGAGLTHLKYSRSAELEADKYGIKYMVFAGYNPLAAVELQKTFLRLANEHDPYWAEGLLSTHPPTQERIRANEATAASYPPGGKWGTEEFEKVMNHLINTRPAYEDLDLGYESLMKGRPQQALDYAKKGIEIEPNEGHLYNLQGKALLKLHDTKHALYSFNEAVDANPEYFDFYMQRGLLEYQIGDLQRARQDLEESNRLLPSAKAHYALGEIALKEGKKQEALEHFRIASQVDSSIGNQARSEAARISKGSIETDMVSANVSLTPDRKIKVSLANHGKYPVRNCLVHLTFLDAQGKGISKFQTTVPDVLYPYQKTTKILNLEPPKGSKYIQIQVIQVDIMNPQ